MGHSVVLVPWMPWVYQGTPAPRSWVLSNCGHQRKTGDGKIHLSVPPITPADRVPSWWIGLQLGDC